jgi:hypothetical protein
MRDNHEGLPEIISAYERDEHFFGLVSLTIGSITKTFEFGIDQSSFIAIQKILQMRPFEQFPGTRYRYFFCPKAGRDPKNPKKAFCDIRIEQEYRGKQFEVTAPESLIANLMWFWKVKNLSEITKLREIKQ